MGGCCSNWNCPTNTWKKAHNIEKYEEMEKECEGDEEMPIVTVDLARCDASRGGGETDLDFGPKSGK